MCNIYTAAFSSILYSDACCILCQIMSVCCELSTCFYCGLREVKYWLGFCTVFIATWRFTERSLDLLQECLSFIKLPGETTIWSAGRKAQAHLRLRNEWTVLLSLSSNIWEFIWLVTILLIILVVLTQISLILWLHWLVICSPGYFLIYTFVYI